MPKERLKATHFMEIYSCGGKQHSAGYNQISFLNSYLEKTKSHLILHTVAVWKIKKKENIALTDVTKLSDLPF